MVTGIRTGGGKQRGIVLVLALVALLLISVVGAALLYMSQIESALVANQRSITRAYTAALGGLEEGKSRLSTSDPTFIGTATFSINFPAAVGDILYILNPSPAGEFTLADVTTNAASPYFDWAYDREWCLTTNPTCGALAAATVQTVNSDIITQFTGVPLPTIPYKWFRITILTEEAAKRDIDGSGGALDNLIPVTWDSASNRMNIIVTPGTQVDRDGDGAPESDIDTDQDGTVERKERMGRYVYRITAFSLLPRTGASRIVQYDVSAPFVNLDFPSAVSLIGENASCGFNQGCDPTVMGSCDSPTDFGPSNALKSKGQDQAPGANPGDGGPSIGCTDPDTCDDCSNELANGMRSNNWTGNDGTTATQTGDITASSGPLGTTQGLQYLIQVIRNAADRIFVPDAATPDMPPQVDGDATNDAIDTSGITAGTLGTCGGAVNNPLVTVMDGDVTLSGSDQGGCGILLVTGTLNVSGNWNWKGIVMVVGEGVFDGAGRPSLQGAQVLARIYCEDGDSPPCPCAGGSPASKCAGDGILAEPDGADFRFNGGGSGGWDYNSMWINNATGSATYQVLAYREMGR